MRNIKRIAGTTVLTGAMVVGSAGAAFAHECMIANRSPQGQQAVGNSPMWLSEDMATTGAYDFTFSVVYGVDATPEMLDEAVALHVEQGLQEWTAFFIHHTLLTDPKTHQDKPAATRHAGDGRGVEHWSDTELGLAMIKIAGDVVAAHA